jgi:hypothetical protein
MAWFVVPFSLDRIYFSLGFRPSASNSWSTIRLWRVARACWRATTRPLIHHPRVTTTYRRTFSRVRVHVAYS